MINNLIACMIGVSAVIDTYIMTTNSRHSFNVVAHATDLRSCENDATGMITSWQEDASSSAVPHISQLAVQLLKVAVAA